MHLPESLERMGRIAFCPRNVFSLIALGLITVAIVGIPRIADAQLQIQGARRGDFAPGEQDAGAGVYLPTDRALSRAIARARERLDQHEYHEALAFLHGLLGRDEDWFLERADSSRGQLGVKATARQLIGELPPEGHDAYELLHGATARRALDVALQSGNRDGVSEVVRQFFHTSAGYEAALVLAQMEADQGHRLAAAQLYQELIATPRAATQFEPQLSVLAALNQLAAGERDLAGDTLRALIKRQPPAEIILSGKTVLVPSADVDLVAWLLQLVGQPSDVMPTELNWLSVRGDPSRNVQKAGGRPHLRARWQARVVNEPAIEAYLSGRSDDFLQRGVAVLPGARPIAVGDVVVMRTPENVVAVDWQTGKRIWETREDDDLQTDEAPTAFSGELERNQWETQSNPLEERVWDDALVMSLSSDGERVFVLRGVTVADEGQFMGWAIAPGFGRMGGDVSATTNQLAAYDIATQGKLVWELDGSRAPAPLEGAFFLGAPLAIDNLLYVMAEIRSAVYLLALDPATGDIQWQQQLLGLEQSVGLDPVRRRAGATPSYAAGILVCPTAASAVVAIDVVKREFAWVYRYPREAQTPAEFRNAWQNNLQTPAVRANDRWLDSSAVIGDGHVFLTPPESGELHCINLQSGKFAWKHRQGDALFIGGVDSGNVLLVGAESVQALRVSDGAAAWQQEIVPLPTRSLPAGHGYLSEGRYYLPLTTGEIAEIETSTGKLTVFAAARPGTALGNLICYRGSVLSQSALVLDKFEQLDVLKQRAETRLDANPDDATALRELAELKRSDGQTVESVNLLKRAFALSPDDALTQEMLAEVLLDALASDYAAFRADVPILQTLIRDREQQIELLRIEAGGLDTMGERLAAFDTYLQLADFTAETPAQLRIDSDYSARSDRWVCGQLGRLWADATDDERVTIADRLAERRPSVENPRTAADLRHYLAHANELPGADEVRQALARLLVDRQRSQEAEIELLVLATSRDKISQAVAAELRLKLDAKTRSLEKDLSIKPWPRGQVDAALIPAGTRAADPREARAQAERPAGYRQLHIEQDFSEADPAIQWFVAMDCSEIVGRNNTGDDVFHLAVDQNNWRQQHRDSNFVHAARLGRLLFVTLGGQVMAINSPSGGPGVGGDVLWQTDPLSRYSSEPTRSRRNAGEGPTRANRRPVYHAWSGRKRIVGGTGVCSLGPVTPRGVVFQEHDLLKCVDPLSGELLWSRSDIPMGCELFGDMEYVFAADVGGRVAHVIRTVDGRLVGKRELPKQEWLLAVGRNVADVGFQMNRESKLLSIRIRDIFSQEVLFEGEFPIVSRISVVEPNAIAIYEPNGRFQLVDARTGEVVIRQQLNAVADVHSIFTMPSGDKLFLLISSPPQPQFKSLVQTPDYPLINGLVYAFSRTTGEKLWPGPAVVRNRGIILSQPSGIPLLVFADRKAVSREAATSGQFRLLCIDQNTGQTVYRNESLPDTTINRFRIRGERDTESVVAIEMSAGKVQLTMTDRPRPPQAPANDDLEAQRENEERGLRAIGRRVGGALQGALENASDRETLRKLQQAEREKKQGVENPPDTDDD